MMLWTSKGDRSKCTLVHVDVVGFHLNRTSEYPPRVNHIGLMPATSMRLLHRPKRLRVEAMWLFLAEKKSYQDRGTSDYFLARPREEEAISLQERYGNLVGSLVDG